MGLQAICRDGIRTEPDPDRELGSVFISRLIVTDSDLNLRIQGNAQIDPEADVLSAIRKLRPQFHETSGLPVIQQ